MQSKSIMVKNIYNQDTATSSTTATLVNAYKYSFDTTETCTPFVPELNNTSTAIHEFKRSNYSLPQKHL